MRRRMVFSTLVVTVIAVMLLGLPLGALTYKLVYDESTRQLQGEAELIGAESDTMLEAHGELNLGEFDRDHPNRFIRITPTDASASVTAGDPALDPEAPDSPSMLKATATTGRGTLVEVWMSAEGVQRSVVRAWLGIASLSLLAIGVAVGLSMFQARRLTLPLIDLAVTAERLGSGVTTPWGHRYGIPEADRVAEVLDRSAERIAGLIATERHFATDASHQLRTPLTALMMRLEEILAEAGNPEVVREEGEAALAQTERLVETVESLLGRARKSQNPEVEAVEVDSVLNHIQAEWQPVFHAEQRRLLVTGVSGLTAMTVPTDLAQIIATLVENAYKHGAGTVTIRRLDTDQSVRIEVSDEGEGVPDHLAGRIFDREVSGSGGTGLGLALARHIAESEGARIELVQTRPTTFALFLPAGAGGLSKMTGPV
ncbi:MULTISPECIES: sensor histidine kinase [Nocardiopsis]|uniref:histidine kinase n=1 Tax=Nocardiopsis sinuspersici TaxID=501010 RepID=A0A1V3C3M1_9ACTN|nr:MULTISPECIES: HAMP domain-containing sensor histidine kinase [Nocardiopsis]NYH51806.1 signal transduction histidine kinase [Nocardiopsis sinuspersici]OOC55394.1 two-component sensor histidine kinase [Nocardiopsis sinuspersici]